MKKIKCKICDCEFIPELKLHYVSRDLGKTGVVSVFQSNVGIQFYDTFDCPQCGCQVVAQTRKGFCYSPIDSKDITKLYEEEKEEITGNVSEDELEDIHKKIKEAGEDKEEVIPARAPKRRVPVREEDDNDERGK